MTNEPKPTRQPKNKSQAIALTDSAPNALDTTGLYQEVRAILDESRGRVARSVNSEMVRAYWQIGQAIVEHEQAGRERADYGAHLIEGLAAQMKADGAKGFTATNLKYMRQFFAAFPKSHALRGELSWTHYRLLLKVAKPDARGWYNR